MANHIIDKFTYGGETYILQDNASGYITDAVTSFNGNTGAVTYEAPVTSVNGKTGIVTVTEDDKTWNGVELSSTIVNTSTKYYVPVKAQATAGSGTANWLGANQSPTAYEMARWDSNAYLYSTTPTTDDNSTKVATTAYVAAAIAANEEIIIQTTATLTVAGWSSANTQTVNVTGVTADNAVIVSYAPSSKDDYIAADVYCSAQGSGTLTFSCNTIPTVAITVNVLIFVNSVTSADVI